MEMDFRENASRVFVIAIQADRAPGRVQGAVERPRLRVEPEAVLVEVHQAGLFQISGYSKDEFEAIVGTFCPNTLFPYAREAVASVVARGGFPEFLLQPINFDALFAESKKQAQAQAEAAGSNGGAETSH